MAHAPPPACPAPAANHAHKQQHATTDALLTASDRRCQRPDTCPISTTAALSAARISASSALRGRRSLRRALGVSLPLPVACIPRTQSSPPHIASATRAARPIAAVSSPTACLSRACARSSAEQQPAPTPDRRPPGGGSPQPWRPDTEHRRGFGDPPAHEGRRARSRLSRPPLRTSARPASGAAQRGQ